MREEHGTGKAKNLSLEVECPQCHAQPGEPCINTLWRGTSHWTRLLAVNTDKRSR